MYNKIKNILISYDKKIINIKISICENLNPINYSFYIFKDDKIIKKYYKLKDSSFKFIPIENGFYKVLGFVEYIENGLVLSEKNFSDIVKISDLVNKNFEISILGSCVTRDIFIAENDNRSDFLKDYYARTTLYSLFCPKHEKLNDVNLKSKFQLQQVYRDFSKDFLNKNFERYEYLLIDFIDERFNMVEFLDSSIITYSSELQQSKYLDNYNIKDYNILKNTIETLEEGINSLVKLIKRNGLENKVILHEAYWKEDYRTRDGNIREFDKYIKDSAVKNNELLSTGYDLLKEKLPSIMSLDFNKDFYADEGNRWGISPFHYESFYYNEIFYNLLKIIQNNNI